MRVVNRLNATEIDVDHILCIYTGTVQGLADDAAQPADRFEKSLPERIIAQDLVLHELNLLQNGFTFWVKLKDVPLDDAIWIPARIDT